MHYFVCYFVFSLYLTSIPYTFYGQRGSIDNAKACMPKCLWAGIEHPHEPFFTFTVKGKAVSHCLATVWRQ